MGYSSYGSEAWRKENKTREEMKEMLNVVFKTLKRDFKFNFARQDFYCCSSCATNAISIESDKRIEKGRPAISKWAFYHRQDDERLGDGYVWIGYGDTEAEGYAIKAAALFAGLWVAWDGTINSKPQLMHPDYVATWKEKKQANIAEYQRRLDTGDYEELDRVKGWLEREKMELRNLAAPSLTNMRNAMEAAA